MDPSAPSNMPGMGEAAPSLSLPDDTGTLRDLAERRGHWTVLYFYPKDDTPGCTTEACEFRDINSSINSHDAEVWGVSVLGSGSKAAFKRKLGLNFVLLADVDHAVAERYGTWVEKVNYGRKFMGIQRATFLIDPDGRIAQVWPKVKAQGHAAEVLTALETAQSARKTAPVA